MATPVSYTLAEAGSKDDIVRAAGSTASGNVIVEVDEDMNQGDIIVQLEKVKMRIIEKYGDATS